MTSTSLQAKCPAPLDSRYNVFTTSSLKNSDWGTDWPDSVNLSPSIDNCLDTKPSNFDSARVTFADRSENENE